MFLMADRARRCQGTQSPHHMIQAHSAEAAELSRLIGALVVRKTIPAPKGIRTRLSCDHILGKVRVRHDEKIWRVPGLLEHPPPGTGRGGRPTPGGSPPPLTPRAPRMFPPHGRLPVSSFPAHRVTPRPPRPSPPRA